MSAHNDTALPPHIEWHNRVIRHNHGSVLQARKCAALELVEELRAALQALAEAQGKLEGAGDVLGRICVFGTLVHGEKPVHDELSKHASVRAIIHQIERAEAAESKLAEVEKERDEARGNVEMLRNSNYALEGRVLELKIELALN